MLDRIRDHPAGRVWSFPQLSSSYSRLSDQVSGRSLSLWFACVTNGISESRSDRHCQTVNMDVHLAVVGDSFADIYAGPIAAAPSFDADVLAADPIEVRAGGSALNTAIQASALTNPGIKVSLHSAIGNDVMGVTLQKHLSNHPNIQLDLADVSDFTSKATGSCIVLYNSENRGFVTHRGCVDEFRMENFSRLAEATHIHIAGAFNCTGLLQSLPRCINELRGKKSGDKGVTVSLCPQYDATEQWDLEHVIPLLDLLILNKVEALKVARQSSLDAAIAHLTDNLRVPLVVITMGEDGAIACMNKNIFRVPACVVDPVVDSTGAGDGFSAGFLWHWLRSRRADDRVKAIYRSLRWGCTVASCCISQVGGSTAVKMDIVQQQYEKSSKIVGLSGPSNAGKTSACRHVMSVMSSKNMKACLISQDDFYKDNDDIPRLPSGEFDWDCPEALDEEKLVLAVTAAAREGPAVILVEGTLIFELPILSAWLQNRILFDTDRETCKTRRMSRTDYEPPDAEGYFDEHVWPAWIKQRETLLLRYEGTSTLEIVTPTFEKVEEVANKILCVCL